MGHLFGGVGFGVGVGIGGAVLTGVGAGVGVVPVLGPFKIRLQETVSRSCLRCMNEQRLPTGWSFRYSGMGGHIRLPGGTPGAGVGVGRNLTSQSIAQTALVVPVAGSL